MAAPTLWLSRRILSVAGATIAAAGARRDSGEGQGSDAVSAARAVLQTGEYDFASVQVEDDVLRRLEEGGKGEVLITRAGTPEHIQVNETDPWKEGDGE